MHSAACDLGLRCLLRPIFLNNSGYYGKYDVFLIIIIIIIIIVRLSLLTMTDLNHMREMLLFVCLRWLIRPILSLKCLLQMEQQSKTALLVMP